MWHCSKPGRLVFAMICASALLSYGVLAGGLSGASPANAQPAEAAWVQLADKPVGGGLATEVVEVGRHAGSFERLRLSADGSNILVHEIRVYFADGDMQRLARQVTIPRNSKSEAYVLEGGGRHIDRVELTYKAQATFGRTASVGVWAEPAHSTPDANDLAHVDDGWELLGKQLVGPAIVHNVIAIGRHDGRFQSLRLRVLQSDVAFHDIRVVYLNGDTVTLAVRRLVRAGDASPPLLLGAPGESRFIREIQFVYEANPDLAANAIVQVWAQRLDR